MTKARADSAPLEPSAREHGTDGYTEAAVGGFGEGYAFQVAHGGDSDEPATPSHSEHAASSAHEEDEVVERAVRKSLSRAHIDAANLTVHVRGSVLHLRGSVRHLFEKAELEARARAVPGVSALVSELDVLDSERR
ncbi:MAG TPA: BON domain-containing protein [Polyangiaceae bacterium]|jgi:hypothetical protein|nr:BON domain-containing protein [Polyangiaceae bacterium]